VFLFVQSAFFCFVVVFLFAFVDHRRLNLISKQ